jgi:hypothetical protein
MSPSMPPPMYMLISGCSSERTLEHEEDQALRTVPHIDALAKDRYLDTEGASCTPVRWRTDPFQDNSTACGCNSASEG